MPVQLEIPLESILPVPVPVPGNHPNLCVRRVCNTGLSAGKSLPVKYTPQTAYPRTHLEKMYQMKTIKRDCTQYGVAGNP